MKKFAVIGLGNFGFYVAKALFEEGHEVLAIDRDKQKVQAIDQYSSEAIVLDATNKEKLAGLSLEEMDSVIVSTGSRISVSVLISLYLHELSVKNITVKALDEDHEKILHKMGVNKVIHPERDMGYKVAQGLSKPNVLDFIPLEEDYNLIQVIAPKSFLGKSLRDLDLRSKYNIYVIAIKRNQPEELIFMPHADLNIAPNDLLMMLGRAKDINKVKELS